MSKYTAEVERDGKFWMVRVPEISRATQARHVREIEAMARDLIAIIVDVPADSFELAVHINLPKSVEDHLKAAEAYREQAAEANRRASEEARVAAKILAAEMPLREVGAVLDVSHQRVHQLVNS
jgi:DNA-directed RNA polymerase specialized sigma subunit